MCFRNLALVTLIAVIGGAVSTAQAQYVLPTHWSTATTIATLSVPKPTSAAKLHQSLIDQRGRMDRQRWFEAADRQAARRELVHQLSIFGQWDVLSSSTHTSLLLSDAGYTIADGTHRQHGVWQHEQRPRGFVLTMHAVGEMPAKFEAIWTVPGQQFKMIHQGTGALYTVTKQ